MLGSTLLGALAALAVAVLLAFKWQLDLRLTAATLVVLGVLSSVVIAAVGKVISLEERVAAGLVAVLTLAATFSLLVYRFYRDPERLAPLREDVIVSPADGEVIYVRHTEGGMLPVSGKGAREYALEELTRTELRSGEAVVIGIAMNFLDVHVNRAPIGGRVALKRHFSGSFSSLKRAEAVFGNERATTVIESSGIQVAVVQIASRLVRQIVNWVDEDQVVMLGQRIGVIRFGSQVDLVLPAHHSVEIKALPGQRVRAGESVVAVFSPPTTVADREAWRFYVRGRDGDQD